MKSGVWILDHDTGFMDMKKGLAQRYGKETAQRIWEKAGRNWEALCRRYAHLPEKVKQHADGQMFRMAALLIIFTRQRASLHRLLTSSHFCISG